MTSRRPRSRGASPRARNVPSAAPGSDWREARLEKLRAVILTADPSIVEEVKWRKPSNPDGVPVWSHDGIVCVGNVLKNAVRLTFPGGVRIADPKHLFNTRLDSRTVRAIDSHESDTVDEPGLRALIRRAVRFNVLDARAD